MSNSEPTIRYHLRGSGRLGFLAKSSYSHYTRWATEDVGFLHTKTGKVIEVIRCEELEKELQNVLGEIKIGVNVYTG